MPYARKSLTEIRNEAIQDITSADISDGKGNSISFLLQKAVLRVLAWVWAGFSYEHYGYLDWISLQSTPWGATDEYAAGWGALISVTQIDAFAATGTGAFTGTAGTDIPFGTIVTRASDGFQYQT